MPYSAATRGIIAATLSVALCSQSFAQSAPIDLYSVLFPHSRDAYRLPSYEEQARVIQNLFPYAGCKTSVVTTYDLQGFWYPATVRVCQDSLREETAGALAPSTGEKLFFVDGRARRGSMYSLMRGYPNHPYDYVRPQNLDEAWGDTSFASRKGVKFRDAIEALPFVPTTTHEYELNGATRYAFGGLNIVPGHERQAYPLNSDSIIVMYDGFPFATPDAFAAMLSFPVGGYQPYMEVSYVQLHENPQRLRHAFIPWLSLSEAGPKWKELAIQTPVGERDGWGSYLGVGLALFALSAILYAAESSGVSDEFRKQQAECHRRQQRNAFVFC